VAGFLTRARANCLNGPRYYRLRGNGPAVEWADRTSAWCGTEPCAPAVDPLEEGAAEFGAFRLVLAEALALVLAAALVFAGTRALALVVICWVGR
jgi:hypothetical protein